jgi:hypothetical protein
LFVQAVFWGVGVHVFPPPHTLGVPAPPQTAGDVQVPHWTTPPQPFAIGPHAFAGHVVIGVHPLMPPPQTFGVPPPPQICPAAHPPVPQV